MSTRTKAPATPIQRRLLDYAGVATYLSVSRRQAEELAAGGEIPKVKIGHRVLFDVADVDAYIERIKRSA